MQTSLPVDNILPALRETLLHSHNAVLSAPPGSGKTTRVPPFLLTEPGVASGRILMLEPRRLAARRAAAYMASQRGERVGNTVGYRIRGEMRVSDATRIEVVTEGVLTRMLLHAPDLPGISLLIFDEFHERSIHADLGLALALDVQANLRDDLRILVMSATLDGLAVARLLGDAPVVEAPGAVHPIVTRYLDAPPAEPPDVLLSRAVRAAIREAEGDVLVFLPGQREIRRCAEHLAAAGLPDGVRIHMLFGEAPRDVQDAALTPAPPGERKVILSTSIAETSLTIDGVRMVVDGGLARSSCFDPRRGMSGLITTTVTRASADQRRGRAGRQGPGICYRLWTERQHGTLQEFAPPEIVAADLAPLALDLACWGASGGTGLRFLDPPPAPHLSAARVLLTRLGALDTQGRLSEHGRAMGSLPVHPRLAHMILRARELGHGAAACGLAALLEEGDPLRGEKGADIDLALRWHGVFSGNIRQSYPADRIRQQARRLSAFAGAGGTIPPEPPLGVLTALAYPERIARRREGESGRYLTAAGTGVFVPEWSALSREEFLAIADVDGTGTEARVYLAAPLSRREIEEHCADRCVERDEVFWDDGNASVAARRVRMLDDLVISTAPATPSADALRSAMLEGIRRLGLAALPWSGEAEAFRARSEWVRARRPAGWPSLTNDALAESLGEWLSPFLSGITGAAGLQRVPLARALRRLFTQEQLRELERLAPERWRSPAGSSVVLRYAPGRSPYAEVRLQEVFGQEETPCVAAGEERITLHLLSPAGRPLAVTQDLGSFWKNAYPEVRKEMRGRYPKHIWPEDPLASAPTRRTVKRRGKT